MTKREDLERVGAMVGEERARIDLDWAKWNAERATTERGGLPHATAADDMIAQHTGDDPRDVRRSVAAYLDKIPAGDQRSAAAKEMKEHAATLTSKAGASTSKVVAQRAPVAHEVMKTAAQIEYDHSPAGRAGFQSSLDKAKKGEAERKQTEAFTRAALPILKGQRR